MLTPLEAELLAVLKAVHADVVKLAHRLHRNLPASLTDSAHAIASAEKRRDTAEVRRAELLALLDKHGGLMLTPLERKLLDALHGLDLAEARHIRTLIWLLGCRRKNDRRFRRGFLKEIEDEKKAQDGTK